ncbi:alanyl (membrane) aminopeptidase-like b isoform X2 [Neoarius graeffei]|nr:alanyl (membrane) aminopeptidase-like b isoform X2 [Neoarius graeffei]
MGRGGDKILRIICKLGFTCQRFSHGTDMANGIYLSKTLAIATLVLTISALSGTILMLTLYMIQTDRYPPQEPPTPSPTTPIPTGLPPTLRLPGNLIPESYIVNLRPHLYVKLPNATEQNDLFEGNSTVRFKCVNETWTIFLHAVDLRIDQIKVTHSDTRENIEVASHKLHNDSEFFEILLKKQLMKEHYYDLFTAFRGSLRDDLTGLYISEYQETDGKEDNRFLLASQLQATEARRVFPCFDEPAMKAVFNVTIIHRTGTKARSNGKLANERFVDGDEWVASTFDPTPIMSTYLLAFTVNEFKSETATHDTKEISVWARPQAVNDGHAKYAMNITGKLLSFYEKKFNLKYSLNKLDQIALPDFSANGMENWGLAMYRESSLLYTEGVSSSSDKEWITTVVAHELAHQWFGNLVTMNWWNNLWLSEGFATYLSYLGVDDIEPTWNMRDMFVLKETQPVMVLDSLNASHPLVLKESEIETTSEIFGLFDTITYSKGAAVLRMLQSYMVEKNFFTGLGSYLEKYKYKTVDTADLWNCLQEALSTSEQIKSIMTTWTEQIGYPVININTITGEISQEHFLLKRAEEDTGLVWQVPITSRKSDSSWDDEILKEKGPVAKPAYKITDDGWLLVNINCNGYYRVNYDEQNWNRLIDQLESNHQAIPLINRGQLIDDAFNLARAKYINVTLALNTTKYLINETEYVPWESALNNLEYFILMFDRSEVYGPIQKYLRNQVGPLYKYFQEYTDNATVPKKLSDQYNQINAISVACDNGVTECTDMATKLFNEWRNGTNRIPPNLKSTIYCSAIATGNEDDWDFAWKQYEEATVATEKDVLRYALSCTKTIWLLNRYLKYTKDPEKIRKMDVGSTIKYIARNVAGQPLAWDFIRAQWTDLSQLYEGSLLDDVTERFNTDFELQQLKQFQSEVDEDGLGPITRVLDLAIERTEANIKWVKENEDTVLKWFDGQAKGH